jgi:AmmeMemoRadiSam system protein B
MLSSPLLARHHPDCYPSSEAKALVYFQEAFQRAEVKKDGNTRFGEMKGIITPHIDFRVSLRAYAEAFAPLLPQPLAVTYVILGVGHRSHLEWNLDLRDYETPLGRVGCDVDLVKRLAGKMAPRTIFEPGAHEGEHSIEFALLWLQALHRLHSTRRDFRFVPLLCGGMHRYLAGESEWYDLEVFHQLSRALGEMVEEKGETLRLVVSIDGCHIGPRFGHPFLVDAAFLQETARWEEGLWSRAGRGSARGFLDWFRAEGNERYFDGVGALALLLEALGGAGKIQRSHYEQWFTARDASAVTFSSGAVFSER